MLKSIVQIQSQDENNNSFGTGFVIDNNEQGVYILTDRGEELAFDMSKKQSREIEFIVKDTENIFTVGIPPKDMNKNLKGAL